MIRFIARILGRVFSRNSRLRTPGDIFFFFVVRWHFLINLTKKILSNRPSTQYARLLLQKKERRTRFVYTNTRYILAPFFVAISGYLFVRGGLRASITCQVFVECHSRCTCCIQRSANVYTREWNRANLKNYLSVVDKPKPSGSRIIEKHHGTHIVLFYRNNLPTWTVRVYRLLVNDRKPHYEF